MKETIEVDDDFLQDDYFSSDEEEYNDDPVIKTYDVFFSNQLMDQIYLLQYPIRNPDEQYLDDCAPLLARIKPNEGSLELDVPIDVQNYSSFRGEKFAGSPADANVKPENNVLDRQRLNGKRQPNQANYFVGTIRGGSFPSSVDHSLTSQGKCTYRPLKRRCSCGPISIIMIQL
jgi:RPC5 protein